MLDKLLNCKAFLASLLFLSAQSLYSAKPKVLILSIANATNKADYNYLSESITGQFRRSLKKEYVFEEPKESQLKTIAKSNYLFKKDWPTKSVSINLGLLLNQDVVISGRYTLQEGGPSQVSRIVTQVAIYDIKKRSLVSEFSISGKADNTIFTTVQKVANRLVKEADQILPNNEEWQKIVQGQERSQSKSAFFKSPAISLAFGMSFLSGGVASRVKMQPPAISLRFEGQLAALANELYGGIELYYLRQTPTQDENPELDGLQVESQNIGLIAAFGYKFEFFPFAIMPELVAGGQYQSNSVTGYLNTSVQFLMPVAGGGTNFYYIINNHTSLVLTYRLMAELEQSTTTLLNVVQVGGRYAF